MTIRIRDEGPEPSFFRAACPEEAARLDAVRAEDRRNESPIGKTARQHAGAALAMLSALSGMTPDEAVDAALADETPFEKAANELFKQPMPRETIDTLAVGSSTVIDCPMCHGDCEISVPVEWPGRAADIDTVPCPRCGGKGTIGRRED